eukprot:scaffold67261_cov54-Phaeocystis_antarctica.AAC.2
MLLVELMLGGGEGAPKQVGRDAGALCLRDLGRVHANALAHVAPLVGVDRLEECEQRGVVVARLERRDRVAHVLGEVRREGGEGLHLAQRRRRVGGEGALAQRGGEGDELPLRLLIDRLAPGVGRAEGAREHTHGLERSGRGLCLAALLGGAHDLGGDLLEQRASLLPEERRDVGDEALLPPHQHAPTLHRARQRAAAQPPPYAGHPSEDRPALPLAPRRGRSRRARGGRRNRLRGGTPCTGPGGQPPEPGLIEEGSGSTGRVPTSVSRPCSTEVSNSRAFRSFRRELCGVPSPAVSKASRHAATSAARRLRRRSMYSRSATEWPERQCIACSAVSVISLTSSTLSSGSTMPSETRTNTVRSRSCSSTGRIQGYDDHDGAMIVLLCRSTKSGAVSIVGSAMYSPPKKSRCAAVASVTKSSSSRSSLLRWSRERSACTIAFHPKPKSRHSLLMHVYA